MPADGMRATGSPARRFSTPVSVARQKVYPGLLTIKRPSFQLTPSRPAGGDDWPHPPNPANIFRNISRAVLAAARINARDARPARRASA
jgi:hypothetical protein